ncbi:Y-family DNA polymerase [Pseudovibrio sp. W64]|uniref:Y-family DNA polymerase n=1 Tax=Pseudovibrio sp. W64 TaxID=1735583 RepID=UPI0009EEE610|nr:DNA polymerase Y family protein [Pseudovibrio sp. W64]
MPRRIVSLWFPRMASDRILRSHPTSAPFAVTSHEKSTERLYCLNSRAMQLGLASGMGLSDAKALCPDLLTRSADRYADDRFLKLLARWADRYCPWVGFDGNDGLLLDVTGSTHFFSSEAELLADIHDRLQSYQLNVRSGLAGTIGGAWAVSHFGRGVVPNGQLKAALGPLPAAALRLDEATCATLQRLGLRTIGDLLVTPRATLGRRFGLPLMRRIDQAFGDQPEQINAMAPDTSYAARLNFPDPIGLYDDVMAALERLLQRICDKLKSQEMGTRVLLMTCQRVDQASVQVELRLARPMREGTSILPLFERSVRELDAGFGIDQIRLEALAIEALPLKQLETGNAQSKKNDVLSDLITRLGSRIGLEKIKRFQPADSHIPERSFIVSPAAYCEPEGQWKEQNLRPLQLFSPELVEGHEKKPPNVFSWRRMRFSVAAATGPERICPEWWLDDPNWRSGVRDYWRVETEQGRRLWMFFTPLNPAWFVQGEFA